MAEDETTRFTEKTELLLSIEVIGCSKAYLFSQNMALNYQNSENIEPLRSLFCINFAFTIKIKFSFLTKLFISLKALSNKAYSCKSYIKLP